MRKALFLTILIIICLSLTMQAQKPKAYIARIALNGGWTIKTGKTPDSYPIYYKDYLYNVKQGFSADVNAQFNINDLFVIGLHYDYFRKSHSMPLFYTEGEQTLMSTIDNTYTNDFIALSLGIQKIDGKSRYMIHYLIGFMDYREKGNFSPYFQDWQSNYSNYSVGHCFGHGFMVNYDYMVNDHIALGLEVTYCIGTVSKLNHQRNLGDLNNLVSETTVLNEPIRLNRLSPKAGLRYYF